MTPKLGETIYVDFITSAPSTGAVSDADSTPTCEVFEDATDAAILSPTVTKRTSKTGNYRIPIACTTGNGFEAGKSYNVVVSATVGGVAAKAAVRSFQVRAASALTDDQAAQLAGIKAKTDLISANNFVLPAPVSLDGRTIEIYRGSDYSLADGNALPFSNDDWPDITGGTVSLVLAGGPTFAGVIVSAHSCYFELTAAQTAALTALGQYRVQIHSVLADGHVPPPLLTNSTMFMKDRIAP